MPLAELEAMVRRQPARREHWLNLGLGLNEAGRPDQALACFQQAAERDPGFAQAHYNCGVILYHQGKIAEAVARYRTALEIQPNFVMARANLGIALEAMDESDAALAAYDEASAIDPNAPGPYWNKALLLLRNGHYDQGWRYYEWRFSADSIGPGQIIPRRTFPGRRLWLGGETLKGKTILLHEEQGLGDMIQFMRFVPMIAALGATIIIETFTPLTRLFQSLLATAGVQAVIGVGDKLPQFDLYCPMMSLPCALGVTLETLPADCPYLSAPGETNLAWQKQLGAAKKPRVAFVWKSNSGPGAARSIPFKTFSALFSPEIEFISLQKSATDAEHALLDEHGINHIGHKLSDFADTAAVLEQCDLVISIDTALAHLAGALGKPVWILLPARAEWRWLKHTDTSPWYPSARLFRSKEQNTWSDIIQNMKAELATRK
ncbi:MAG: tetratricopeptide repeat protein [Acidocella sp.]|nr:tetratricopeptide repeat protein [Acidocella sp.]